MFDVFLLFCSACSLAASVRTTCWSPRQGWNLRGNWAGLERGAQCLRTLLKALLQLLHHSCQPVLPGEVWVSIWRNVAVHSTHSSQPAVVQLNQFGLGGNTSVWWPQILLGAGLLPADSVSADSRACSSPQVSSFLQWQNSFYDTTAWRWNCIACQLLSASTIFVWLWWSEKSTPSSIPLFIIKALVLCSRFSVRPAGHKYHSLCAVLYLDRWSCREELSRGSFLKQETTAGRHNFPLPQKL